MNERVHAFLEAVSTDDELRAAVEAIDLTSNQAAKRIVSVAHEHGFELTIADLTSATGSSCELDLDELDGIAGGASLCSCPSNGTGMVSSYACSCDCTSSDEGSFGGWTTGDEQFMGWDFDGLQ